MTMKKWIVAVVIALAVGATPGFVLLQTREPEVVEVVKTEMVTETVEIVPDACSEMYQSGLDAITGYEDLVEIKVELVFRDNVEDITAILEDEDTSELDALFDRQDEVVERINTAVDDFFDASFECDPD